MKKALISRYAAYGDILHMSMLPRLLKENGYDIVDVETNYKGYQLLCENPFIDNLIFFEPTNNLALYSDRGRLQKHWDIISKGYDKFVNLFETLESDILSSEFQASYYMHPKNRKSFAEINYYDKAIIDAGYPELVGKYRGEVYYTDKENEIVARWMNKYEDKFSIIVNLSGTTIHKKMIFAPELVHRILDKYEDVHVILTGDKSCLDMVDEIGESDRITSICGNFPFRQALLITQFVNLAISMESGFGVGANMWEVPTIQLMTAASLVNHPNGCKNDHSLQSPAYCSPCNKGPYKFIGCPHKDGYPLCIYFDVDKIMQQVEEVYVGRTS